MFPKGLGDMAGMMKTAMNMKANVEKLKTELGEMKFEGSAGGGMVKVLVNGRMEALSVTISPEILQEDAEAVGTMVQAAFNQAITSVQEVAKTKMQAITGGIEIPGFSM